MKDLFRQILKGKNKVKNATIVTSSMKATERVRTSQRIIGSKEISGIFPGLLDRMGHGKMECAGVELEADDEYFNLVSYDRNTEMRVQLSIHARKAEDGPDYLYADLEVRSNDDQRVVKRKRCVKRYANELKRAHRKMFKDPTAPYPKLATTIVGKIFRSLLEQITDSWELTEMADNNTELRYHDNDTDTAVLVTVTDSVGPDHRPRYIGALHLWFSDEEQFRQLRKFYMEDLPFTLKNSGVVDHVSEWKRDVANPNTYHAHPWIPPVSLPMSKEKQ
jgi:hypothetical protein